MFELYVFLRHTFFKLMKNVYKSIHGLYKTYWKKIRENVLFEISLQFRLSGSMIKDVFDA